MATVAPQPARQSTTRGRDDLRAAPLVTRWGRTPWARASVSAAGGAVLIALGSLFSIVVWSLPAGGAPNPTVSVSTNATFGPILTDGQGFALYTYSGDDSGIGTCTGSCAAVWPPLTVPAGATPSAGPGVSGTVAAVLQPNGTYQVTYGGSPLYAFVGDSSPGQVTGNGTSGFSVVKVATPPPSPTTTVPTSSTPTTSALATSSSTTTSPATSPSSSSEPAQPTTAGAEPTSSVGSLAFTGPGTGLQALLVVGLAFIVTGGFLCAVAVPVWRHRRYVARRP
jgi:predicted lipoprotein with Yx(FWY)xxD motif